jgi:hypothetical protein
MDDMTEDTKKMKVYRVDSETITKNTVLVKAPTDWEAEEKVQSGEVWESGKYEIEETDEDLLESTIEATEVQEKTGLTIKLNTWIDQGRIEKIRELIEDDLGVQILSIDEFVHTDEDEEAEP